MKYKGFTIEKLPQYSRRCPPYEVFAPAGYILLDGPHSRVAWTLAEAKQFVDEQAATIRLCTDPECDCSE